MQNNADKQSLPKGADRPEAAPRAITRPGTWEPPQLVIDLLAPHRAPPMRPVECRTRAQVATRLRWLCADMIRRLRTELDTRRLGDFCIHVDEAARLAQRLEFVFPPVQRITYERDKGCTIEPGWIDASPEPMFCKDLRRRHPEILQAFGYRFHDPEHTGPVDVWSSANAERNEPKRPKHFDPWGEQPKTHDAVRAIRSLLRWISVLDVPRGEAVGEATTVQATATTEAAPRLSSHSDDFSTVEWFGQRYEFNPTQARVVGLLWAEWQKGGHGLNESTIGDKIGSSGGRYRLAHTFRTKGRPHPAWGTAIRRISAGTYALSAPDGGGITK